MRTPRQLCLVVAIAAVLATVVAAAPAVLAALPKVDVYPRESCVVGPFPDGTDVTFSLRSASGVLKDSVPATASEGMAFACFDKPMRPGDRIRIASGGQRRSVTAIGLTLARIDRAADAVKGRTAPGRRLKVLVHRCGLDQGFTLELCPVAATATFRSRTTGRYTADTTAAIDLRGRDLVEVVVRNATGDRFRDGAPVPVFFVDLGKPGIDGRFHGEAVVDFTLLDGAGGPVIGRAALPSAEPRADFQQSGVPVPVQPGDQVVGDFSADGRMLVPAMITLVNIATDAVTATCFPNQPYLLRVNGPTSASIPGTAGADGSISLDTTGTVDLTTSHDLLLRCMSPRGDTIDHQFPID